MMLVESYQLSWHPSLGAAFRVKGAGVDMGDWVKVSAGDLAAVAAILRESPCYLNPKNGALSTGAEQPKP